MPERIQLSRRKGWRKPENTVVVARPSKWGNPLKVGGMIPLRPIDDETFAKTGWIDTPVSAQMAVDYYRKLMEIRQRVEEIRYELAGKNLACWCRLDQPCHADVLMEIANGADS